MRRILFFMLTAALAVPAVASAQQTVNFYVGAFVPHAPDARPFDDVVNQNMNFLDFNPSDFNGATVGGEWLFPMTDHFEGGLGIGFYTRSVDSVYLNLVNSDGTDIPQQMKLRIIPFTATVRFLPLGHGAFEPYIGGGVVAYRWRYAETGQFVDNTDNSIFNGNFVGTGSAVGGTVLGGARLVVDPLAFGGEIRWQSGKGTLPGDQGFAGNVIDLGGFNYLFTVGIRF